MTETNAAELTIVHRTVIKEIDDRVEVEWRLSSQPDLEWSEIFQMAEASGRRGSIEWVKGGGPDVLGDVVRWFVPAGEIESADTEVRERLSVANQRTRRST